MKVETVALPAALSLVLLGVLAAAAVGVGMYASVNPNHIQMEGWSGASVTLAGMVCLFLAVAARQQRRHTSWGLLAVELAVWLVALLLLAYVSFVLSFNQL